MNEHDEQTKGGGVEERPYLHIGSFEYWLNKQVDRQDNTGAVARFVLADIEKGCWEAVFDFDYYMMRDEKMRQGMVKHLALHHPNLGGKDAMVLLAAHKEYERARQATAMELIEAANRRFEEGGFSYY